MARRGVGSGLLAAGLLLTACGGGTAETAGGGRPTGAAPEGVAERALLSGYRIVDLSHPYDASTLYWPTSPSRFESEILAEGYTEAGFYYLARRFSTPEHGGTHLDAPVHFAEHGWALDEIPLERLIAPAVVIDVSEAVALQPDYRLSVDDVRGWEDRHGPVPKGSIVLLLTGWSRHWPDEAAYYGRPQAEGSQPGKPAALDLHFPSYGAEAARLLIEERGVAVLGVDTASIDFGPSRDFPVHRLAGEANVPGLENLTRLDALPAVGATVIAAPIRMVGGSGSPVRVVALVPR